MLGQAQASPSSCSIWSWTVAWLMLAALSVATPAMRRVMAAQALSTTEASVSTSPFARA